MKFKITLVLLLSFGLFSVNAQDKQGPSFVGTVTSMEYIPSIASRTELVPAPQSNGEARDGRSSGNKVIIGKDQQSFDDYFASNPHRLSQKIAGKAPSLVFDAAQSNSQPTDPSLAVGPNHVIVVFNTGFRIFDKSGIPLTGQISPNPTIFPNGGCCDLTASYDSAADRFILSFLGGGAQIAVSDGPDPINDGWFNYTIGQINDYQKLSVWSDGYYLTDNTSATNKVWVLDRTEALAGNPTAGVQGFNLPGLVTSGFFSPQVFNVSDDNMPATGGATVVYLQDDAWAGVPSGNDHFKLWTIDVDFATPANSTVSTPVEIPATPFISVFDGGSFSNLAQPNGGISIDALQATIMNQAQFRKFGTHNSAIFNFVIDTDASAGELAGIRWYEIRQTADGQPWTLFQEGTYTAPDGRHAWHASMMMDTFGNIGMGYSSMSGPSTAGTVFVSSYYTGRFANDPINTMTITEEVIANGNANIPGLRYGDYSKIDIDPVDDQTFWFINEYMNSGRKDVVGVFKIAPDFTNDTGVISIDEPNDGALTATEQVTVTVFNYGEDPQSNIPVELTLDGTSVATEILAGPLASATSVQYTFTQTVDLSTEGQTYNLVAQTNLAIDEDNSNDATTRDILHVFANDIGVTAITAPSDGEGLGMEDIVVTIENFGTADQSNFDVSYTISGGQSATETVAVTVPGGGSISYTFAMQGDFSVVGTYEITATTLLSGDSVAANDSAMITVSNVACESSTNDTNMPIGPNGGTVTESIITVTNDVMINDLNVTLNLTHTFTGDLDIFLEGPDGTRVELSTDNGGTGENMTNTTFDDDAAASITTGTAPFTGSWQPEGSLADFNGMMSAGDWLLEITDDAGGDAGELLDWTLQVCEETPLGILDNLVDSSELIIVNEENNQFNVLLPTHEITERLTISVTNMLGQTLMSYRLDNEGGGYSYDLDMSYAASGVYIVRLDGKNVSLAKRLIVK